VNEIITKSEHTLPGCGLIQIKLLSRRQSNLESALLWSVIAVFSVRTALIIDYPTNQLRAFQEARNVLKIIKVKYAVTIIVVTLATESTKASFAYVSHSTLSKLGAVFTA